MENKNELIVPNSDEFVKPFFDKKTNAIYFLYKKKFLKVEKDGKTLDVEFLDSLLRDRMQIRILDDNQNWKVGDLLQILGTKESKSIYTCIVKKIKNKKAVIKKIEEIHN